MDFAALLEGLYYILTPTAMFYLFVGVLISSTVVALPGIDTKTALALSIPVVFTLDTYEAVALIIGIWGVSNTANSITSILFAIPGGVGSQATILDGYPMSQQGQSGRALAASFTSSALGGIFGVGVLFLSIPIMQTMILLLGSAEMFLIIMLGIGIVGYLSGKNNRLEGIIVGTIGLLVGTVGIHVTTGSYRFTFDIAYMMDGFSLIPVTIGLFAIPELITLVATNSSIDRTNSVSNTTDRFQGVKDTFTEWKLVIKSSIIGTWIGIIPGLGGAVADWIAYGFAKKTEPGADKTFGKGDVRGVIAIDAATNAKEGGSLIPTLAFGIPGSPTTALVLTAFTVVGIVPGKDVLDDRLYLLYSMIWLLLIATVFTSVLLYFLIQPMSKLTKLNPEILVPFLCIFCVLGTFSINNSFWDCLVMLGFTGLGYWFKLHAWPRSPLLIGMLLGPDAERYLSTSVQLHGWDFFITPSYLVIIAFVICMIWISKVFTKRSV